MSTLNEEVCQLKKRVEELEKGRKSQTKINKDMASAVRGHSERIEEIDYKTKIEEMQQSLAEFEGILDSLRDEDEPKQKKPKRKPQKKEVKKPTVKPKRTATEDDDDEDISLGSIYDHI